MVASTVDGTAQTDRLFDESIESAPLPDIIQVDPLPETEFETSPERAAPPDPSIVEVVLPLRIGLLAPESFESLRDRVRPFRFYLIRKLDRPVEIVPFRTVRTLIDAHSSKRIDYAAYSASAYAWAYTSCRCLTPLVAPTRDDGGRGFYALLVTRFDSGLGTLSDFDGRVVALASQTSTAGYRLPVTALKNAGFDPRDRPDSITYHPTTFEALDDVMTGKADIAAIWSESERLESEAPFTGTLAAYQRRKSGLAGSPPLRVLWSSALIPYGPHAVRDDLDEDLREDILDALISFDEEEPEGYDAFETKLGGGYEAVSHAFYAPLLDVMGPSAPPEETAGSSALSPQEDEEPRSE